MPIQVDGVLLHAMSGTELSRVRTSPAVHTPIRSAKSSTTALRLTGQAPNSASTSAIPARWNT
jgi:hypothetical protein